MIHLLLSLAPQARCISATCLHKPWAAWSSRDLLPGAAWTWGSWAEKGASVEISFPTSEHQV